MTTKRERTIETLADVKRERATFRRCNTQADNVLKILRASEAKFGPSRMNDRLKADVRLIKESVAEGLEDLEWIEARIKERDES